MMSRNSPPERTTAAYQNALHELLDVGFEGWGDEAYFRFKYTDFPGYDPDVHDFLVERDGEVVAARRIFSKHLDVSGRDQPRPVHVHGGAVVHPGYRRQGLFTDLVERARTDSRHAGSPVVMTFNRRGKISTEAHMQDEWEYRTLPLHILPLSPGRLIEEHAERWLPDVKGVSVATGVARATTRLAAPRWMVARAIELATSGHVTRPLVRSAQRPVPDDGITLRPYATADCERVVELFDAELAAWDVAFARGPDQIRHMVGYDHGDAVVAVRGETVVGFACLGLIHQRDQTEARVFELLYGDETVGDRLLEWVVKTAQSRDADVVSLVHEERPGPNWASLRTDLVMWDRLQETSTVPQLLASGDWRITGYDVV